MKSEKMNRALCLARVIIEQEDKKLCTIKNAAEEMRICVNTAGEYLRLLQGSTNQRDVYMANVARRKLQYSKKKRA